MLGDTVGEFVGIAVPFGEAVTFGEIVGDDVTAGDPEGEALGTCVGNASWNIGAGVIQPDVGAGVAIVFTGLVFCWATGAPPPPPKTDETVPTTPLYTYCVLYTTEFQMLGKTPCETWFAELGRGETDFAKGRIAEVGLGDDPVMPVHKFFGIK